MPAAPDRPSDPNHPDHRHRQVHQHRQRGAKRLRVLRRPAGSRRAPSASRTRPGPLRSLRRLVGADRSRLVRLVDRGRSGLALLTGLLLAGAVAGGVLAGLLGLHLEQGLAVRQAAARHRIIALVESVTHASNQSTAVDTGAGKTTASGRAVWTGPDGRRRAGVVTIPDSTAAGSRAQIWIDRQGNAVEPPTTAATAAADGALTGAVVFVLGGATVLGGLAGAARRIDRRAAGAWEREWAAVEPAWTGRRR